MTLLITSDLHFTDKPTDEYRWEIFPWLQEQVSRKNAEALLILGDVTDRKDNHSAKLVNRLVDCLYMLAENCVIHILCGNHDCIDPTNPFFRFLDTMEHVRFYVEPAYVNFNDASALFLPHSRDPKTDWKDVEFPPKTDYVFMHHTFEGARASTGQQLSGSRTDEFFRGYDGEVFSGDIHVPQSIGPVTYVGSPYPVHFGDRFEPRVLLINPGHGNSNLLFESIQKLTLEIQEPTQLNDFSLNAGDQLKVRLKLSQGEALDWPTLRAQIKEIAEAKGVYLSSVELMVHQEEKKQHPAAPMLDAAGVFNSFCEAQKLDKAIVEAGKVLIDGPS